MTARPFIWIAAASPQQESQAGNSCHHTSPSTRSDKIAAFAPPNGLLWKAPHLISSLNRPSEGSEAILVSPGDPG